MKVKKNNTTISLSKAMLLKAVANTYEDSKFFMGRGISDDCDFSQGLTRNKSAFLPKATLLDEIMVCDDIPIKPMLGHPDYLVLNPRTYVSCSSISENQVYHTDAPEGYYHSVCKYNPHLDVYIKIDREGMTISFILGSKEKTLKLEHDSTYTYKLLKTKILCSSVDSLEKFIKDEFFNPMFINFGRKALGQNVCECFKT